MLPRFRKAVFSGFLALTLPAAAQTGSQAVDLVLRNARVVEGTGAVREGVSVAILGERIFSVTRSEDPLRSRRSFDATGKTLLPGLINTHVHIGTFGRFNDEQTLAEYLERDLPGDLREYLVHGVTSIKSVGDMPTPFLQVRERLSSGQMQGPRLFLAGPVLTAPGGHPAGTLYRDNPWLRQESSRELGTPEEARTVVRQLFDQGVDAIKLVYHGGRDGGDPYLILGVPTRRVAREVMEAVIDEAHRHGLPVTIHTAELEDAMEAAEAGADGLEHGVTVTRIEDDRLGLVLEREGIFYGPTLSGYLNRRPEMAETLLPNLRRLAGQGVRIVLGTDGGPSRGGSGSDTVKELELMVRAGLSPHQAIEAATRNPAELLGRQKDLGTVEAGKLADLILVDGDPLADISALARIRMVIQGGRIVVDNP